MQAAREAISVLKENGTPKDVVRKVQTALFQSAAPALKAGQAYLSTDASDEGVRVVAHSKKSNRYSLVNVATGRISLKERTATELAEAAKRNGFVYAGESIDDVDLED